ncbi:MAG: hypothetical protein J0I99_04100 [Devosia sp.]|uniref:hypothetical protein n=1 Tax=Devosia sp. TaxID=1871048 RepID=UPI001AD5438B|nr:hypothetical protein [Devosia sp.]MBN9308961.1 hypothetical protein [Devosia sp.]MBN9314898.1 hypothetical protein [Devosia sp.]
MYFYHEGYIDAQSAALEDTGSRERSDGEGVCEAIRMPAILTWLAAVTVALCGIVAAIQLLS